MVMVHWKLIWYILLPLHKCEDFIFSFSICEILSFWYVFHNNGPASNYLFKFGRSLLFSAYESLISILLFSYNLSFFILKILELFNCKDDSVLCNSNRVATKREIEREKRYKFNDYQKTINDAYIVTSSQETFFAKRQEIKIKYDKKLELVIQSSSRMSHQSTFNITKSITMLDIPVKCSLDAFFP